MTVTRSCALHTRIIVTSDPTLLTRTLARFPPAVVYGRPMTSHSPVSSVKAVPDLQLHRQHARFGWRFVLAPGCSAGERAALLEDGVRETGSSPTLDEAPGRRAGIAIVADGASVDATLDGLVADRADVEALLLKRFDELHAPARRDVCRE